MRFKKLRIFVAAGLLFFILIVGNIFAFGYIQNSKQGTNSDSNSLAVIYENKQNVIPPGTPSLQQLLNNQQTNTQTSTTTTTQASSTQTSTAGTIVHTTVRTRAS